MTSSYFIFQVEWTPDLGYVLSAGTYQVVSTGQPVAMHPSSVLFGKQPSCVVFNEIVWTTKQYMVSVAAVEQQWLREAGPQYFA